MAKFRDVTTGEVVDLHPALGAASTRHEPFAETPDDSKPAPRRPRRTSEPADDD